MNETAYYTPQELGKLLKVTDQTIYRLIESEHIRAVKVGRQWRIAADEVRRYLGVEPIAANQ